MREGDKRQESGSMEREKRKKVDLVLCFRSIHSLCADLMPRPLRHTHRRPYLLFSASRRLVFTAQDFNEEKCSLKSRAEKADVVQTRERRQRDRKHDSLLRWHRR